MKPFNTSGMLENDDELESVLRDYFQQEMPPELLEIPDITDEEYENRFMQLPKPEVSSTDRSTKRPQRQLKVSVLIMLGLCVCMMIGISFNQFSQNKDLPVVNHTIHEPVLNPPVESELAAYSIKKLEPVASLAVVDQGSPSMDLSTQIDKKVQESIDITLYNTELGPIEQRTEISWTNITIQNPKTGTNMEMSMPELTIDFVPVSKARLSLINEEDGNEQ